VGASKIQFPELQFTVRIMIWSPAHFFLLLLPTALLKLRLRIRSPALLVFIGQGGLRDVCIKLAQPSFEPSSGVCFISTASNWLVTCCWRQSNPPALLVRNGEAQQGAREAQTILRFTVFSNLYRLFALPLLKNFPIPKRTARC